MSFCRHVYSNVAVYTVVRTIMVWQTHDVLIMVKRLLSASQKVLLSVVVICRLYSLILASVSIKCSCLCRLSFDICKHRKEWVSMCFFLDASNPEMRLYIVFFYQRNLYIRFSVSIQHCYLTGRLYIIDHVPGALTVFICCPISSDMSVFSFALSLILL